MNPQPRPFRDAVEYFWRSRKRFEGDESVAFAGRRQEVVGGSHFNEFLATLRELLISADVPQESVFYRRRLTLLPGYFRATKMWDLLVVSDGELQAVVELKAQVGPSFGNNANNRAEEALGNAVDLWTAYRDGAYSANPAPWVGYLFLLEDCDATRRPLRTDEPHFPVLGDFRGASYAKRYEFLLRRMVIERHYSSACLLLSEPRLAANDRNYTEPAPDLSAARFIDGLLRRCSPLVGLGGAPSKTGNGALRAASTIWSLGGAFVVLRETGVPTSGVCQERLVGGRGTRLPRRLSQGWRGTYHSATTTQGSR